MSTFARRPWLKFGAVMLVAVVLHLMYLTFMTGWAVVQESHAATEVEEKVFGSANHNDPARGEFRVAVRQVVAAVVGRMLLYDFLFSLMVVACCVYIYSAESKKES